MTTRAATDAAGGLRRRVHVSLEISGRASRIFRDYVPDLYFPADRLTSVQCLRCASPLPVEHLVCRVDAITEQSDSVELDATRDRDYVALHRYEAKAEALLHRMGAYNQVGATQVQAGEQYVRTENRVTSHRSQAELLPDNARSFADDSVTRTDHPLPPLINVLDLVVDIVDTVLVHQRTRRERLSPWGRF